MFFIAIAFIASTVGLLIATAAEVLPRQIRRLLGG